MSTILRLGVFVFLGAVFSGAALRAQSATDSIPPPEYLARKRPISPEDLARKKEGYSWMLVPGVASDPDLGFVIGLMGGVFRNGPKSDPTFAYSPYRTGYTVLGSWSTRGVRSFVAELDAPYVRHLPWRLRAHLVYDRNPVAQFFGLGTASMRRLRTPDGTVRDNFDAYQKALRQIVDGTTYAYYNYFIEETFIASSSLERDLAGGAVRVSGGLLVSKTNVTDYTGREVPAVRAEDGHREDAVMNSTRLLRYERAGAVTGFGGGWDNAIRIGLAYDTRDQEPHPSRGIFGDVYAQLSTGLLGSSFSYGAATACIRWYRLVPSSTSFVVAARALVHAKTGSVPFYEMSTMSTTDRHQRGLGGGTTLRGFRQPRFVAPIMVVGNLEVRSRLATLKMGDWRLDPLLVPFLDLGRVYDRLVDLSFSDVKTSYGLGLRFVVNQSFTLSFDLGFSDEDLGLLYVGFGQIF